MPKLDELQDKFGYQFKDVTLLERALTHRSMAKDHNERLEFLGDSVLSFVMSDMLYQRYGELSEGELSRVRSGLVNGEMLADMAREYDLGNYINLGQGEINSGGRDRDSILADAIEAVIGAVYLDGGVFAAQQLIMQLIHEDQLDELMDCMLKKDPKSALQEWAQARKKPLPVYSAEVTGLAHEQNFSVTCHIEGVNDEGFGQSTNRRKAERLAAHDLMSKIKRYSK